MVSRIYLFPVNLLPKSNSLLSMILKRLIFLNLGLDIKGLLLINEIQDIKDRFPLPPEEDFLHGNLISSNEPTIQTPQIPSIRSKPKNKKKLKERLKAFGVE